MSDWKSKIPACFGAADRKFAGHPYDQQRARELRKELRASGVSKLEIEHAFEDWLAGKTPNVEHSKAEMAKVKKYFDL